MNRPGAFYTVFAFLVTLMGCCLCVLDDRTGVACLNVLAPMMGKLSDMGAPFVTTALDFYPKALPYMCLTLLIVGLRRRGLDGNLIFLALTVAIGSEYFLLMAGFPGIGVVGYIIALACVFFAIHRANPLDPILDCEQRDTRFTSLDCVLLSAVTLIALCYRMFALNYNLNYFEGELSTYSAAATSIPGSLIANRGHGAWAPLGLLYYLPIWLTTQLFGTTLVALRLSSAIVGVLTIPLLYLLAQRIAGRQAAIISAFLLALNTQHVGWSRTDIHPHGVTTWPVILVCLAFLKACKTNRLIDWSLLTLAMGLTWHQYPSGQSAVAIPVFAAIIFWCCNRFSLPFRWYHSFWIILGVLLWFIGLPLSYWWPIGEFKVGNPFNLTGPRALWGGLEQHTGSVERGLIIAQTAVTHLWDVIEAIFFRARYIFHQDFLADVNGMAPRTYPWLLTPFMFVGLVMLIRSAYRIEVAVLLAWIIAAIAPGIFSEQAYPKRLSTLFPALDLVGAIGVTVALAYVSRGHKLRRYFSVSVLTLCLACYAAFEARVWFSNTKYRMGEPPEVEAMKTLAGLIRPNSLVIAELSGGYYTGKVTYLLLDHLTAPQNRPNLWYIPFRPAVQTFIQDPLKALNFKETWAYQCTKLRSQVDETAAVSNWQRVVFILQEKPSNEDAQSASDIAFAKQRCNSPQIDYIPSKGSFWLPLVVVSCDISDLKT